MDNKKEIKFDRRSKSTIVSLRAREDRRSRKLVEKSRDANLVRLVSFRTRFTRNVYATRRTISSITSGSQSRCVIGVLETNRHRSTEFARRNVATGALSGPFSKVGRGCRSRGSPIVKKRSSSVSSDRGERSGEPFFGFSADLFQLRDLDSLEMYRLLCMRV